MPKSMPLSATSATCLPTKAFGGRFPAKAFDGRLEWRPSLWPLVVLAALIVLAPFAVLVSEMPRGVAWPLALAASTYGGWLFRREQRKPSRMFVFSRDDAPVLLDGEAVDEVTVHWRGPLAFVRWRDADGCVHRLAWWPDTLPPARRRELRLAAPTPMAAPDAASMAP
jgi:toxin CptA